MLVLALLAAVSTSGEPKESCEALRARAKFSVHFERVELAKLVQTVSDATCKTFIVGDGIRGSISLVGPENTKLTLDADQFYAAFLAALDSNGFMTVRQGRLIRVVEKTQLSRAPVPMLMPGAPFPAADEIVTRVFVLEHVEAEPARTLLAQFAGKGGEVTAVPPRLIVATDGAASLQRLEALVKLLDVEKPADVTRLLSVRHADASDLAQKANATIKGLAVLPDERTNRLLVAGPLALVERAEALVRELDVEVPGDGRARVYRLKNADAKELAPALEGMAQVKTKPGVTAPAAGAVTGEVKITVNEALNALVIVASAGDYRALVEVIEQLDVPVRQVFIETVIMEVNADRDATFGLSFHGVGGTADNPIVYGSQPTGAPSSLSLKSLAASSGLLLGAQGPILSEAAKALGLSSWGIAVRAAQTDTDVNVMSTPYLLTTDNKEAEIVVGQRVPFQQGTSSSQLAQLLASGNASTASTLANFGSNVTRERVELKLTVKPHIGDGDQIRLEVNQSAEEIAGGNELGPVTSTRSQKTMVVAEDAQTLVLGGIMQDRTYEKVEKTPVLGDLPILGRLFRNTQKKTTKVNLLVILTPHIIRGPKDLNRLLAKKTEDRRRLLELLYGGTGGQEPPIDFARRRGPLATMFHALAREEQGLIVPAEGQLP